MHTASTTPAARIILDMTPTNNAGRAMQEGVRNALTGSWRTPVESMVLAYREGWEAVRPLPAR